MGEHCVSDRAENFDSLTSVSKNAGSSSSTLHSSMFSGATLQDLKWYGNGDISLTKNQSISDGLQNMRTEKIVANPTRPPLKLRDKLKEVGEEKVSYFMRL
ncbi:hypothetical protein AB6A40_001228 [Gnathostoma spinigerum]|uniref:Uncharacterized protein n=1 Tax=Gnathostoma spinigerum TaxID=75299 RepID=A0ABD6E3N9_9BILA